MRATIVTLGALALSLSLGCDKTEEATPTDSGPIVRDVGFADTPSATDVQTPTDTPPATDVQTPTDAPAVDAGPGDVPAADVPATDAPATDVPADAGPVDAGSCVGDGGCFACAPTTSTQFLNRCSTASCARFDNAARLTRLNADGGLPPLP